MATDGKAERTYRERGWNMNIREWFGKRAKQACAAVLLCTMMLTSCTYVPPEKLEIPRASDYAVSYHLSEKTLTEDEVKACNPKFGQSGYTYNCALCANVLELNKHGYSVQAGKCYNGTESGKELNWWFGACYEYCSYYELENELESRGPGASGVMAVHVSNGYHELHWDINSDGELIIEDGQIGWVCGSFEHYVKIRPVNKYERIPFIQLDKCEPCWTAILSDGVIDNAEYYQAP